MIDSRALTLAAAAGLLLARSATAQDAAADSADVVRVPPIVVTVSRVEIPAADVASSITVVTREEIEARQLTTVREALMTVPGVSLVRAGGPGGATTVFLRGASSEHALVLLDGIELNDPSLPTGGYDLATLGTAGIYRIEVLRGPQSAVHGSSALGGVINILTRRGEGEPRIELGLDGGSYGSASGSASTLGARGGWSWFANVSRRTTDGFSASPERLGNVEDDGSRTTGLDLRVDRRAGAVSLALVGHLDDSATDLDQTGPGGDDPNRRLEDREAGLLVEIRSGAAGDRWRPTVSLGWSRHDRESLDDPDPAHPSALERGEFEGASWKLAWINDLDLGRIGRLIAGVETERERAVTSFVSEGEFGPFASEFPERTARTTGAFTELRSEPAGGLSLAVGARTDDHDRFGAAVTVRVAPAFAIRSTGTRLRATWGTGFKAPTLFQLYDPTFGSPELDPERSRGWDAGVDQALASDRVRFSVTGFGTRFENLIAFASEGYRNENESSARGVETSVAAVLAPSFHVIASYTHTRTESETGPDAGLELIRRPRHQGSVDADWTPERGPDVSIGVLRIGQREDLDFTVFPAERVTLDPYTLVRVAVGWDVTDALRLHGRIENLLDAEYEEVVDFGTAGRAAYVGATVRP
jgi:vitamin B12 transporter